MVDCAGARLHVYARSIATVLRVDGEIDASNADSLANEIRRFARMKSPLILDLSNVEFLGIDGFRALLRLNHEHEQARLHFTVVTGRALRPLLRLVTNHGLNVVDSVPEALQMVNDVLGARRNLLAGLARLRQPEQGAYLARAAGDA
ncbi:sulfate transporter [Mycobacterium sp. 1423905.2]|nr:sulfate transporter [Mycobacterium sp. 1423905.2]